MTIPIKIKNVELMDKNICKCVCVCMCMVLTMLIITFLNNCVLQSLLKTTKQEKMLS